MVKIYNNKVVFYLIICIQSILISCDEDKQNEINYFYEFDYVEHYYLDSDASKLIEYFPKYESCIKEVVYFEYENGGLNDSINCYEELESFGYKKNIVPRIKHNDLKELFVENEIKNKKLSFCDLVYRDILICNLPFFRTGCKYTNFEFNLWC